MTVVAWSLLLVSGIAAGAALCSLMIVPVRRVWVAAGVGLLSLAALAVSTGAVWRLAGRIDTMVASGAIATGALVGGFALAAAVWPEIAARLETRGPDLDGSAPPDETVRVILLADAEPELYSPVYLAAMMRELQESEVPVPPEVVRVLFYAQERARYARIAESPARPTARAVAVRTSLELSDAGFTEHARVAFCAGSPSLAEALADGVRNGGRRFVVAQLAASDSREMDRAKREADRLEVWRRGVEVAYTTPLWSSAEIAEMVAARVIDAFGGAPRDGDGVVLASEGQPWQWDRTHPAASEHATFLSQRVRAELVSAGMPGERVRTAWMEWDEPGVTEVVRHLAALGSRRILVVPATMPFDSVATLIDLRQAAEQAGVDPTITVAVSTAWGDDPVVADVLAARVLEAADELT